MKVKLKHTWFAPSPELKQHERRPVSGQRYRGRQVHVMPDYLFDHLPKDAEVLVPPAKPEPIELDDIKEPVEVPQVPLSGQAASDAATTAAENEEAEKLDKAREARRLEKQEEEAARLQRAAELRKVQAAKDGKGKSK